MIELMKQTVEVLKTKVAVNLEEIRKNETRFRLIVAEGINKIHVLELNSIIENNKGLLAENIDIINIQISILRFIEKYQYTLITQNVAQDFIELEENMESMDYFDLTIKGDLPYSPAHHLFNDDSFFGKLMSYYESKEDYEKCSDLIKMHAFNNLN